MTNRNDSYSQVLKGIAFLKEATNTRSATLRGIAAVCKVLPATHKLDIKDKLKAQFGIDVTELWVESILKKINSCKQLLGFHVPYARRGPHGEDDRYYIKFNEPQSHELISKVQNHQHNLGTVSHTRATVAQLAHIVFSTEARLKNDMPPAIARKMRSACRKFGNARMDLDETLEEYVEYMAGV